MNKSTDQTPALSLQESQEQQHQQQRIPAALQQVFLQSNRGKEVHSAPPNSVASKVYHENWKLQRSTAVESNNDQAPQTKSQYWLAQKQKQKRAAGQDASGNNSRNGTLSKRGALKRKPSFTGKSPQQHLDQILEARGYARTTYKALHTAYHNTPTPLQVASYGPRLVEWIRSRDIDRLREILPFIHGNACNINGESILHMVARRGDTEVLELLLEEGRASVQVSDDMGRNPLHDVCWVADYPAFDAVELILQRDLRLLCMQDRRGALPLDYIPRAHWSLWREFLDEVADTYFPLDQARTWDTPPPLCIMKPDDQPLPDPPEALPGKLVYLVCSGQLSLEEALFMQDNGFEKLEHGTGLDEDDYFSDEDEEDESSYFSDDSDSDFYEEEAEDDFQVSSLMNMVRAWDS